MQVPMRAICVFHAAAKAGSVSKAATELNVTPSAVTQQIQLLEIQLGTSLMVKVGRRVALSEAGERYFASIRDPIEQITEATEQIRGFRSLMTLNVRATPTLSNKWLLPRLGSLIDLHPDLEVRLDGTNEPTDFDREIGGRRDTARRRAMARIVCGGLGGRRILACLRAELCQRGQPNPLRSSESPPNPFGEVAGAMAALVRPDGSGVACAMAQSALRSQPYGDRRGLRGPGNRA